MRKIFRFLTVFFIFSLFFTVYGAQNKKNINAKKNIEMTILYTNDLHAHVDPFLFRAIDEKEKVGGFANITAFVKDVRKKKDTVFFFDAGTISQGRRLVHLQKEKL